MFLSSGRCALPCAQMRTPAPVDENGEIRDDQLTPIAAAVLDRMQVLSALAAARRASHLAVRTFAPRSTQIASLSGHRCKAPITRDPCAVIRAQLTS